MKVPTTNQFELLTLRQLSEILSLTIKGDEENKLITFLCMLSAYTDESQFNISFNAPSSTGKSFIPLEVAELFPKEDVLDLGICSPTAFYHEQGDYDKASNTRKIDLSRKIIIFLDQPGNDLLTRLRSLLSHDQKEMRSKITDKSYKGGNNTKTVIIKGFPAVIFSSASLLIDEQESTRFFLLSPEMTQEKISQAVIQKIKKESNKSLYFDELNCNKDRQLLKQRIVAIKDEKIDNIVIPNSELIEQKFIKKITVAKPRYQRDIGRVISLIKVIALLNCWHRERNKNTIFANEQDIDNGFYLWEKVYESQELDLPPYIFDLYKNVIIPAFDFKNKDRGSDQNKVGLTRQEILDYHFKIKERMIEDWKMRQQILPMLQTAGLIKILDHGVDRRIKLIVPLRSNTKENSECGREVGNQSLSNQDDSYG